MRKFLSLNEDEVWQHSLCNDEALMNIPNILACQYSWLINLFVAVSSR